MQKQWRFLPHDSGWTERLIRDSGLPPVVAQLLVSRGVYEPTQVKRFLDAKLAGLHDPANLPGVTDAAACLIAGIKADRKIVVYGDYDADGMTGTALLYNGLRLLRANVSYYVPNRLDEGYGLNCDAIRKLAERGAQIIVTVDCGITSTVEAELCKELAVQLIITDHHQFGEFLPEAEVIVHPRLPNSQYPFGDLCGAGVAFKLLWALFQQACGTSRVSDAMRDHLMRSLGLAAIATIADVVPLLDENRVIVTHGLRALKSSSFPGIAEILRVTKLDERAALGAEDVAFMIAPRLNAAGRLGQAQLAVELLTTDNPQRATALAEYLHQLNVTRESLERTVYLAAHKQAKEIFEHHDAPALVLADFGWHVGVIGVVAGRLAERYCRPVVIISLDALGAKPGVGSARAGGAIDIHEAIKECEHLLVTCGGHAAAAGLKVETQNVEAFRAALCDAVLQQSQAADQSPQITIDAESTFGQLTLETVGQLESLSPFGCGNPRPVLCASGVELAEAPRKMGNGERHLSVKLKQHGITMRSVAFGQADWAELLNEHMGKIDVAYRPVINEYRGYRSVEIHLVDWRPSQQTAPVAVG
jgi:single-stranded-DNA-specific exonuclease